MQRVDVTMAVENLVKPLVESEKMELVDVEYKKKRKAWYLRVFIDKDGGVKDYERFKGKLAKIYLYFPVNNKKSFSGKIIDVEGDAVSIEEKESKEIIK